MKSILRASSAIALLAFAAPAFAQEEADDADTVNGDIIVTAQKRSENVQDVPVAVTVLSGEAIGGASRPSIESAAQLVPTLNFLKSGTTLNQTIFLRGVGTATFSIAGEPSVSTVVDGVVYQRSGEAFSDLVDIQQMEVLRGPQGTLFGKNASAGVINITSVMPKNEFGGTVEASYYGRAEYRVKGSVNVPMGPDLAARFSAFYGEYDGNIRNVTTNEWVNGYKHYGARAQFLYNPGDNLKLYFAADWYKNDDDCCADIIATPPINGATGAPLALSTNLAFSALPAPLGANTRQVSQNLVTSTKEQGWGASLSADIGVGSHTLTSITSYREWDNTEIRDGDWLDRAYVGFTQLHDDGPQTTDTFTQELRLTSPADQTVSYVLGAYYSKANSERTFTRRDIVCTAAVGAPSGVLIPCGSVNANPSTTPNGSATFGSSFENLAFFGQATLNLSDTVRLIGGLRYTTDDLSVFHSRVSPLTGPGIQPNFDQGVYNEYVRLVGLGTAPNVAVTSAVASSNGVPFRTSTSNDNFSGKFAFQADLTEDNMLYASYTRGYKGPAYNVFYNLTATGTNVIEPETSDAYEIGLKNQFFDRKLTLNLGIFYAKYTNFQANNPDLVAGVVVTRFTNAGEISTRGIEADFSLRPIDDLNISGGVALTHARVDQFNAAPGAAPTAIIPGGTPLGYAPTWKGAVSVDYRIRTGGAVDVFLGSQMNFQSEQLSLFAPDPIQRLVGTIPGYALVNAQIGVGSPDDKWKLTFQVRNLFDKAYAAAIINGGPGGSYRYQIPRDADRYFGVNARFNF